MPFVTVVLTTPLFLFIAFLSQASGRMANPFSAYSSLIVQFLTNNVIVCCVGFFVLLVLFFRSFKTHIHYPFLKKCIFACVLITITSLAGFFLAFGLLYSIAFAHLNILALTLNTNPQMAGVISDRNSIVSVLKTNVHSPEIITSEMNPRKEVLAIAYATTGKN